ncbi:MAG: hypothetical protein H0V87_11480 [Chloroflexi bacterium]|nr:hypothetical protein [Chloroflexota bacterium]
MRQFGLDQAASARWLPDGRAGIPHDWPESGDRRPSADGDEIEPISHPPHHTCGTYRWAERGGLT